MIRRSLLITHLSRSILIYPSPGPILAFQIEMETEATSSTVIPITNGDSTFAFSKASEASDKYANYLQLFRYIDKDSDGMISPAELTVWMSSLGEELCEDAVETVLKSVGSSGYGIAYLGFDEFVRMVEGAKEEDRLRSLREAFRVYEMEGCGYITAESLRRVLAMLGDCKSVEECKTMIGKFDVNGDGVICFDEFCDMML